MAYPDLLEQLVDARDEANALAHSVTTALQHYDAAVSSSANSIGMWASPRGYDVMSKFSFVFSDAIIVTDSLCDSLYVVESACFRVGITLDGLDDAEVLATKTKTKVGSLSRKWRKTSQMIQTVLSNPVNLTKLDLVLPGATKTEVVEVVAGLRDLVISLTTLSTLASSAKRSIETFALVLQREYESAASVSDAARTIADSDLDEDLRSMFQGLVPSASLPPQADIAIWARDTLLDTPKGDVEWLVRKGEDATDKLSAKKSFSLRVPSAYVLAVSKNIYNKHGKLKLLDELGSYLWADSSRGRAYTEIFQDSLYPYPQPIAHGDYMLFPMLPHTRQGKKFKVKITGWSLPKA